MTPFKIFDISGDVGLTAYGNTKEEAFINAATGMYSLITDPGSVLEKKVIHISVENQNPDGLLVSWLNELVFHFDAYGFIGKKIVVEHFSDNKIRQGFQVKNSAPNVTKATSSSRQRPIINSGSKRKIISGK